MAINTIQQPFLALINKRIHSINYPAFYTASSTRYTENGMKFKYEVNTKDGVLSVNNIAPAYVNGIGVFNPTNILKSELGFDFNPNITDYTKCPNTAIQYRIDVEETGITSPASTNFFKCWGMNVDEDFNYLNYCLTSTTNQFLTKYTEKRKVTLNDRGTLRLLSGTLINSAYTAETSNAYEIVVEKTIANGNKYYYRSSNNPYYSNTNTVGLAVSNATLEDLSEYVLDIPAYPWNIEQMTWGYFARHLVGDVYETVPNASTTNILSNAVSYRIWTADVNDVQTSMAYEFEMMDDCGYNAPFVQLAWENEVAGIDYFTPTFAKEKTSSSSKSTFLADKYQQGGLAGTYYGNYDYIGHNELSRGETVYNTKITTNWIINTGWLNAGELIGLEWLFNSKNVLMRIDDTWYPVIILNEETLVQTDVRGFKNFEISLRLANKKYIL